MSEHVCNHDDFMGEHIHIVECHINLYVTRDILIFLSFLIYFYKSKRKKIIRQGLS